MGAEPVLRITKGKAGREKRIAKAKEWWAKMGSNLAQNTVCFLKQLEWCTRSPLHRRMRVGGLEQHLVQFKQAVITYLHHLPTCWASKSIMWM